MFRCLSVERSVALNVSLPFLFDVITEIKPSYLFPCHLIVGIFCFLLTSSSYLRVTLDDGKQRLVYSEEHSLVALRGQVVEWHRLQCSEDHDHMMRIGDEPLPLAQQ